MDLRTFLAVAKTFLPVKVTDMAKMSKNGIYMSHTRPSEYFGGLYLRSRKGMHSSSLRGVDFGPQYAFTGKKRDLIANKKRFLAGSRQNGQK